MSESNNSKIHEHLLYIQTNLKAPKGQKNSFGNYYYRSCEDILEAVKPLASERGCTIVVSDEIWQVGGRVYVKATAILSDGNGSLSSTAFAREAEQKKGMDDAQITGSSSSYARKYALNGLFAIDDTKDDDTRENTDIKNVKKEDVDNCSTGDVIHIADLCKETGTDIKKVYEHFKVNIVPTRDQSSKIIASLKKKLASQLDSISQSE